jgi:eukaryotic-like serine/threonine-protein kinase
MPLAFGINTLNGKTPRKHASTVTDGYGRTSLTLNLGSNLRIGDDSDAIDSTSGRLVPVFPMSLSIGEKLGPYVILAPIGAGGMGEVYKANDTRLDRIVAIKTSKTEFSERFEREARAVAALNHPNICHLYDVGPNYLVMEYIEGAPLKGPLPLDQALKYAAQICDALDAAHKKGITHRDLKPANILVTRQGIKLLDFGIAHLSSSAQKPLDDATLSAALTGKNEMVGTVFYMSPEQLQSQSTGREIDGRSDIFSFGLMLYEMLTGKRAFDSTSAVSVIAAIIERPAPSIGDIAPPALDRVLQKCLAKDPDERWQSARDLKDELQWIAGQSLAQTVPGSVSAPPALRWRIGLAAAAAALVLAAGLGWMGRSMFWGPRAGSEPVTNTSLALPDQTTAGFLALSPDGQTLAFNLLGPQPGLTLRPLGSDQFQPLSGTFAVRAPFWSADGKYIAFFQDGKLKYVSASGGPAQELCSVSMRGGTWNQDNVILVSDNGELFKTAASGGGCTRLPGDPTFARSNPYFLPDGKHFLYQGSPSGPDIDAASKAGIYVASLDNAAVGKRLLPDDSSVVFAPADSGGGGYLLFQRDDALVAQVFNAKTLEVSGEVYKIADSVSTDQNARVMVAAAANGLLVYGTGRLPSNTQMIWLDRTGKPLAPAGPVMKQSAVALSPNGRQISVTRSDQILSQVWLGEATGGAATGDNESRLTNEPLGGSTPVWSPDGKIIVFTGIDGNLYRTDASGGGKEELLLKSGNVKHASDWSRDGRFLFYTEMGASTQGDIWVLPNPMGAAGESKPYPFLQTAADESQAQLSPDGRWVAYTSNESGKPEVYVRPFPSGEGRWKVSVKEGMGPRWRGDGRELFYIETPGVRQQGGLGYNFLAVPVTGGANGSFVAGTPLPLFIHAVTIRTPNRNEFSYAVSPDGQRFLVLSKPVVQESIHVLTNWTKQLEKK